MYAFVGNDGVNILDYIGLEPEKPYKTYALAKAAAVEDLRKAGWKSWKLAKAELDALGKKHGGWSNIPPQVHENWAVYQRPVRGTKLSKNFIAGVEKYTLHYCVDDWHYYTEIMDGKIPTATELENGLLGRLDPKMFEEAIKKLPKDSAEAIGHTHIVQKFWSNFEGRLKVVVAPIGLSPGDRSALKTFNELFTSKAEIYVVEFDDTVHP
ncbi:MAG: hypothetical protein K9N23_03080 [Akkermansiaceae bacterium]|nr:hypothetical protein [Akkermansiaceae bacterium]MCF7730638.1 hypothetical protein [Akkermansiaceae bacterium]